MSVNKRGQRMRRKTLGMQFNRLYMFLIQVNVIEIKKFFLRTRKSDSPCRFREGPVTRLCGNVVNEKTEKPKVEQVEADDDSSRESEKPDNNDNDNSENEDVSEFL